MQKKRKNPPAWYTFSNLTTNTSHTIPMNRAARRALKKMTRDVAMLPAVLKPLTKAERIAKIAEKEARRAVEIGQIEKSNQLQHSGVNQLGENSSAGDSNRDEQSGEVKEEAQAQEVTQHVDATKETTI